MPDIRTTPALDDFNYADENPLSNGGKWQAASTLAPMQKAGGAEGTYATRSGSGTGFLHCYSGWNVQTFSGDAEIWGYRREVGNQIGHNERLALWQDINPATGGEKNGYLVLFHQLSGSHRYYLYRTTPGSRTQLAVVSADENLVLLRRNGNFVEVWDADETDPTTWTMRIQVTDTTYMGPYYLVIGEGDNSTASSVFSGWLGYGGGIERDSFQQIIRRVIG